MNSWGGPGGCLRVTCSSSSDAGGMSLSIGELLSSFSNIKPYGVGLRLNWTNLQIVLGSVSCDLYWGDCVSLEAAWMRLLEVSNKVLKLSVMESLSTSLDALVCR